MADNVLFLVHVQTGRAVALGKHLFNQWEAGKDLSRRVQELLTVDDEGYPEHKRGNFALCIEHAAGIYAIDQWEVISTEPYRISIESVRNPDTFGGDRGRVES